MPEAIPEAIRDHWIMYSDVTQADLWQLRSEDEEVTLRVNPLLRVDDGSTQVEAVRQGLGVSALSPMQVLDDLESGALVRILPRWSVGSRYGVFAVYAHRALLPRRVSVFIDIVAARLEELDPRCRVHSG